MRRALSLVLVIGLVLNIVIPVYASETVADDQDMVGFWRELAKGTDIACASVGFASYFSGGAVCAVAPVAGAVCLGCAAWGFYRAWSGLGDL